MIELDCINNTKGCSKNIVCRLYKEGYLKGQKKYCFYFHCCYCLMMISDFITMYPHTVSKHLPSNVATQARIASRAAVLSPGEGSVDC